MSVKLVCSCQLPVRYNKMFVQVARRSRHVWLPCRCRSTYSTSLDAEDMVPVLTSDEMLTDYSRAKPFSQIPGPGGLPYFGSAMRFRKGPLQKYHPNYYYKSLLEYRVRYGNIVKETIAGTTVVHLFDPGFYRQVYARENKTPNTEPIMAPSKLFRQRRSLSLGMGNTNGAEWYKLRQAVRPLLMKYKAVHVYMPFVTLIADDFIERLKHIRDADGNVHNFRDEISKWVVEGAAMTAFETRLGGLSDDPNSWAKQMIQASGVMFREALKMKFKFPFHQYVDTPAWKRLVDAEDCFIRFTTEYVEGTISKIQELADNGQLTNGQYAYMSGLLGMEDVDLTLNDIIILTLSLFEDGLSTTSPTLASILYCIARHPDTQEKLYSEISSVVPDREQVNHDMIGSMPYLKAVIKEALRFFPIGIEVTRTIQDNMVIGGYQLPSGTRLELNNFALLQDPEHFENPREFRPERWLRDGSTENIDPYVLTPFGVGPRMCPGRRLSEQEMHVIIIKILQNFRLEWKHKDLGQKFQILMVPDAPVDITFHDRTSVQDTQFYLKSV